MTTLNELQWGIHISEIDQTSGDCTLIDDEVLIWANNRMYELQALLEMFAPHVFASADAAHIMMDGGIPRRHPIDELVERIKAVIPDETS